MINKPIYGYPFNRPNMIRKYLSKLNPLQNLNTQINETTSKIIQIKNTLDKIQKNQSILVMLSKNKEIKNILDGGQNELKQLRSNINYLINTNTVNHDDQKILIAKNLLVQQSNLKSNNIQDYEFKVFSQWGDDGIIQFLIRKTKIINPYFIEFGVEDYSESNTRFLLMNNNWSGLIIDGSVESITTVKRQPYFWKHDLTAVSAWITKKNINGLLSATNQQDIGLLHIDIDGNDYWIWQELDISQLRPTIVIIEYNSIFGKEKAITIPYSDNFYRTDAHFSNLYFGASLKALVKLSQKKGYVFIGCNSSGNNAYFVRKDRLNGLSTKTSTSGYTESKFRESRDKDNDLTYTRNIKRKEVIKGLPVYNTELGKIEKL